MAPVSELPTRPDDPRIDIRRSARRKRTVQAREEGGKVVVLMPAGLPRSREDELVMSMLERLNRKRGSREARGSDDDLAARAATLSRRFLDGEATPRSVRWVPEMTTRWASATPSEGTIRVSRALDSVPGYVLDYILVHELAHLVVPGGHTPEFWARVAAYPKVERAIGYLEAFGRFRHTDGGDGAGDGAGSHNGDGAEPADEGLAGLTGES